MTSPFISVTEFIVQVCRGGHDRHLLVCLCVRVCVGVPTEACRSASVDAAARSSLCEPEFRLNLRSRCLTPLFAPVSCRRAFPLSGRVPGLLGIPGTILRPSACSDPSQGLMLTLAQSIQFLDLHPSLFCRRRSPEPSDLAMTPRFTSLWTLKMEV